jgi:branched-chain amino acid aminotransferase
MNFMTMTTDIKITRVKESKFKTIDLDNVAFGTVYSDHMFSCDFKNGEWQQPEITPYQPLQLDPSARVFHYGQAVFEGMKAYKDEQNDVWVFRPEQNWERICFSSKRLAIPEVPKEIFMEGLKTLLNMDSEWVVPGIGNSLYIRPFVFATQAGVSASPAEEYKFMIICTPVQAYYKGGEVKVKISDHYSRAANGGVGATKAAGNYAAQFYPTKKANEEGYQQIIWTNSTHEYLEEAGTMNVFFRVGDKLITAPTDDRILNGITRKSIIALAEQEGITVEVRKVSVTEIIEAAKSGMLKEVFGTGTAAVIVPITGVGYKDDHYDLPKLNNTYATKLKGMLLDIQYNVIEDNYGWTQKI